MDAFERFKRKYCADEFGTVMTDGRMTDVSSGKIYRLREAILESKRVGRPLTDGEMKKCIVLNDNYECVPNKNDRNNYYVQAINMFSDDFMKNGRVDNIKQQREKL